MKQIPITNAVKIKNQRVKPFDGEKKYLATGGLIEDTIKTEVITYKSKPTRADLLLTENQLIVARMKGTNKVLLIDKDTSNLIVSTGFLVLEVQEGWHPRFLFHYLVSSFFQKQKDRLSIGATQKAINNEKFKEILIPEISYVDQKRIVKILDEANTLRQKRKQAIVLLDEYLKSIFLEMFGDPVKNTKKWKETELGNLLNSLTSGSRGWAKFFSDEGEIFLTIKNVGRNNQLILNEITYVNPPNNAESKRTKVREGDILLSITADLGRIAVVEKLDKDAYINQHLAILRLKDSNNKTYISHYLSSNGGQLQINKMNKGAAKAGLNFNDIKSINIQLPPIELQNEFETTYKKQQAIKQKMIVQSEEMEKQFQALIQSAFY